MIEICLGQEIGQSGGNCLGQNTGQNSETCRGWKTRHSDELFDAVLIHYVS